MAFVLESYTYLVLIFLLEVLVYLENLWLIMYKEDEIWHAVIYGNDGDARKIFEDLTNTPEERGTPSYSVSSNNPRAASISDEIEAGALFHRPKTKLQKAVETDVVEHGVSRRSRRYDMAVQARLEAIADRLANSSRRLTKKESERVEECSISKVSILWMAIHRKHKSDVDYLLTERNQKLDMGNTFRQKTILHKAVSEGDCNLVRDILEKSLSASPDTYINAGDDVSRTALHDLVCKPIRPFANHNIELDNDLKVFGLLLEHGASIDALDELFMTPLHLLFSRALFWKDLTEVDRQYVFIILLDSLLLGGAEVQTKDTEGNTPLHIACELQNHKAIEKLILNGADPETLNRDGKTPRRAFLDSQGSDKEFWRRMTVLSRQKQNIGAEVYAPLRKPSQSYERITKAKMAICDKSPVYCRYQRNDPNTETSNPLLWTAGDISVSDVLYPKSLTTDTTFLAKCVNECQLAWDDIFQQTREVGHTAEDGLEQESVAKRSVAVDTSVALAENSWVWVNFPANNATWIKRMSKDTAKSSKHDDGENTQTKPMVSLAIPFIDIEVQPWGLSTATPGEEAYPSFTGLDGVQMPQTLDQTSFNAESLSKLRCKENQVIYRWSEKQGSAQLGQLPLEWRVRDPFSKLASLLRKMRRRAERYESKEARSSSLGRTGRAGGGEGADYSARMQSIRKERCPKWLMVRQLWLWKLNDGTVITAIPSRRTMCMADELLEAIRESNLHGVSSGDELMKHIVKETITFPNKFMRAGLGEHILNIFEGEIASEADEEATFYNNFTQNDWDSKHANKAINCTWRVKDIRDELGLIEKVFLSQLEVVKQFAKILTPPQAKTTSDPDYIRTLVAELEGMIKRIKSMDNDAATTLESLNNITQAMLAQASLKEAESARLMNFIILPFTIVTVIFTPLSFMTSLFAVNSDGFPHNEEGELRIPSDWFWWRMGMYISGRA
ncbi:hypothetical protein FPHYL_4160 [Fusarium phyllophilum]|uniref:Ankyrin repeat protein n=1 Tax=Fusarium phyllophilum TaxID=47803 RepID=A0A8H5K5U1_9HYPO|nr:hypothetical protein FPHYL_4160 [Fusarium phyllophilum]